MAILGYWDYWWFFLLYSFISWDTINVLEENIDRKISDIPCSNIFTNVSPRARDIKERINKWDFIKIKSFCKLKKIALKWTENQLCGKTYLPMIPWTSVLSPKYIKNSLDSTLGRQKAQLRNGQESWTDTSARRTNRGPRDIWKMLSITSPQRDANQNHNEIPLHISQNGHHKQINKQ